MALRLRLRTRRPELSLVPLSRPSEPAPLRIRLSDCYLSSRQRNRLERDHDPRLGICVGFLLQNLRIGQLQLRTDTRLHKIHCEICCVFRGADLTDGDFEHLIEVARVEPNVESGVLPSRHTKGHDLLRALESSVGLLPFLNISSLAEALVMMLAGRMVTGVRFPTPNVVPRPVHVHIGRGGSHHESDQEQLSAVSYSDRNSTHRSCSLCAARCVEHVAGSQNFDLLRLYPDEGREVADDVSEDWSVLDGLQPRKPVAQSCRHLVGQHRNVQGDIQAVGISGELPVCSARCVVRINEAHARVLRWRIRQRRSLVQDGATNLVAVSRRQKGLRQVASTPIAIPRTGCNAVAAFERTADVGQRQNNVKIGPVTLRRPHPFEVGQVDSERLFELLDGHGCNQFDTGAANAWPTFAPAASEIGPRDVAAGVMTDGREMRPTIHGDGLQHVAQPASIALSPDTKRAISPNISTSYNLSYVYQQNILGSKEAQKQPFLLLLFAIHGGTRCAIW